MKEEKFTCDKCGGNFIKALSDGEALDEMKDKWGSIPKEDRVIICDDCWKELRRTKYLMVWTGREAEVITMFEGNSIPVFRRNENGRLILVGRRAGIPTTTSTIRNGEVVVDITPDLK